ncbi:hypothetical protein SEA_FRANZY_41 [Arthrobacter phage Franzy]|uniref:Uncharacterized protein n=1 Tax=Arthrobacter phage Franzy TaxID=2024007 RepID=A0A222Z1V9_9CAUD|nr:hypothetical protein SEA_FRANZY_41 [Arthrobacter phage Franzy]
MTQLSIADARAQLFRLKQARTPLRENIESLQEHVEHTKKQIEDLQLIDDTMADAENRAQVELDAALERHEDEAAARLRVQIEAEELRQPGIYITLDEKQQRDIDNAVEPILRRIKDNPQA